MLRLFVKSIKMDSIDCLRKAYGKGLGEGLVPEKSLAAKIKVHQARKCIFCSLLYG